MAELHGLNGAQLRFRDDEHADGEWHEYGTATRPFVREAGGEPGEFLQALSVFDTHPGWRFLCIFVDRTRVLGTLGA